MNFIDINNALSIIIIVSVNNEEAEMDFPLKKLTINL